MASPGKANSHPCPVTLAAQLWSQVHLKRRNMCLSVGMESKINTPQFCTGFLVRSYAHSLVTNKAKNNFVLSFPRGGWADASFSRCWSSFCTQVSAGQRASWKHQSRGGHKPNSYRHSAELIQPEISDSFRAVFPQRKQLVIPLLSTHFADGRDQGPRGRGPRAFFPSRWPAFLLGLAAGHRRWPVAASCCHAAGGDHAPQRGQQTGGEKANAVPLEYSWCKTHIKQKSWRRSE